MHGFKILLLIHFIAYRSWVKWIIHYSGIAFIAAKLSSNKNEDDHPSFFIWLFTIYVAVYGLASQRYEKDLTRYQNTLNLYGSLVAGDKDEMGLNLLNSLKYEQLTVEPALSSPVSVYKAFIGEKEPLNENELTALSRVIFSFLNGSACSVASFISDAMARTSAIREVLYGADLPDYFSDFGSPEFVLWTLSVLKGKSEYEGLLLLLEEGYWNHAGALLLPDCPVFDASGLIYNEGEELFFSEGAINVHYFPRKKSEIDFGFYYFTSFQGLYRWEGGIYDVKAPELFDSELTFVKLNLDGHDPKFEGNLVTFSLIRRTESLGRLTRWLGTPPPSWIKKSDPDYSGNNRYFFSKFEGVTPPCTELRDSPRWNVHSAECDGVKGYGSYKEMFPAYLQHLIQEHPNLEPMIKDIVKKLEISLQPET